MKPFKHQTGHWAVQFSAKLSGTGKRLMKYYATEADAKKDIKARQGEREEHGKQAVTAEERHWILFAKKQLGTLDVLPDVIAHWRQTGAGSITPTLVSDAVQAFQAWQLPRVKARTASDIRYRLKAFAAAFDGRHLHQLHAGELETWLYSHSAAWSRRSFYKRLLPLFAHAVRHRWLAENPMLLLRAPDVPADAKAIYTGEQFNALLVAASASPDKYLLPFIVLTGFCWMRASELVRLYSNEDVLDWGDVHWERQRIHIRESVGKSTRRRSGNERFLPLSDYALNWLALAESVDGRVVPVLHAEFADKMRVLHREAGVPQIHNGLRRSAISHYLAAYPETGIGQLALWAGTSEATIKRHYREILTPEEGETWFKMGVKFTPR
jgi:hypothetical protein